MVEVINDILCVAIGHMVKIQFLSSPFIYRRRRHHQRNGNTQLLGPVAYVIVVAIGFRFLSIRLLEQ